MPYGLTGAMQTCRTGLDKSCKDCVDNYTSVVSTTDASDTRIAAGPGHSCRICQPHSN